MPSHAYVESELAGKKVARAAPKSPPSTSTKPHSGEGQKKSPRGVFYAGSSSETHLSSLRPYRHQAEYKSYSLQFRTPKEPKHGELGRWNPLTRALRSTKSDARYVRRAYRRASEPQTRDELIAEYQKLIDLRFRGEISQIETLKLRSVEAKLDLLDAEHAETIDALRGYTRDIERMDELIKLGERLKSLL